MYRSDFLFATPSFIGGMASVLDIGATLVMYNESRTPEEADYRAIESDWGVVGNDIRIAIDRFKSEYNVETQGI
ncbi:MAG: hypothetical protein JRG73_08950 [Deltaproteobacteria bacterium]|nr:hypothetical protein [Deltaproteobacteria bacterium]MBW2307048.1 hypothetical protein [Deltaproteobacteria bacterium]